MMGTLQQALEALALFDDAESAETGDGFAANARTYAIVSIAESLASIAAALERDAADTLPHIVGQRLLDRTTRLAERVTALEAERDDLRYRLEQARGKGAADNDRLSNIIVTQHNEDAALRAQLAAAQQWQPVADGYYNGHPTMIVVNAPYLDVGNGQVAIRSELPDDLRLCRRTP